MGKHDKMLALIYTVLQMQVLRLMSCWLCCYMMPIESHKYEIILYWSSPDQVFVADVPELPGCMAHGATQEQALAQIQNAQLLWIKTAQKFGDPIPVPKGQRLMFA